MAAKEIFHCSCGALFASFEEAEAHLASNPTGHMITESYTWESSPSKPNSFYIEDNGQSVGIFAKDGKLELEAGTVDFTGISKASPMIRAFSYYPTTLNSNATSRVFMTLMNHDENTTLEIGGVSTPIVITAPHEVYFDVPPGIAEGTYDLTLKRRGTVTTIADIFQVSTYIDKYITWQDFTPNTDNIKHDAGYIERIKNRGWNQDASSNVLLSGDGHFEFMSPETKRVMCGLNKIDTSSSYTDLDYAFYTVNNRYYIYEAGKYKGIQGKYSRSEDTFSLKRSSTSMEYLVNDTIIYTSTVPLTEAVFLDCCLYEKGSRLKEVRIKASSINVVSNT